MIWAALYAAIFVGAPATFGVLDQPAGDRQPNRAGREAERAAVHRSEIAR